MRNIDNKVIFGIVIPLHIQQLAIQMQLLVSKMQNRVGIPFGKDAFDQPECWQDYPSRIVYTKQLSISLGLYKEIKIPPSGTTQIMFQPKFTATSCHIMFHFQV